MQEEFNFNLQNTAIYQSLRWARLPVFLWANSAKKVFGGFFILILLAFLIALSSAAPDERVISMLLGAALISFSVFLSSWTLDLFFITRLKHPALTGKLEDAAVNPPARNLAEFLSLDAAQAVSDAFSLARKRKPPEVDSSMLLYFLLSRNPELGFIFSRANLDLENIRKLIEQKSAIDRAPSFSFPFWFQEEIVFSDDFTASILEALQGSRKAKHSRIEAKDLIVGLTKHNPILQDILMEAELKLTDIENLAWWLGSLEKTISQSKKFWDEKNLSRRGGLAREWTSGYTLTLDRYSADLTAIWKGGSFFDEVIGHAQEIAAVERALSGVERNNVLLVGEPGVGRRSVIRALAQKIVIGESLPELNYKRVVGLNLPNLLSTTQNIDEAEAQLNRIFQEAVQAGNVVLVIEEFHNYVGGAARPGVIDISGILADYLNIPQFQIVATTSFEGLHKNIEQNPSLLELFEKVEVAELSPDETIRVLEGQALALEKKYKKFVTYPALREIVNNAARYIPGIPFPKKALDLLDEVIVYAAHYTKSSFILPEHVLKIIAEKTQIPVGKVQAEEKKLLLGLEELLHRRIINQNEAVNEISSALRRARADISPRKGPMGTFLFMGPTGVGKTETSKALAGIYFKSESRMIRLDMSEFQTVGDIARLLGSVSSEGLLVTPVRENPFSLLLLDEIEKAHPNILNLFLQVLDEGFVTDGLGRKVDFSNTIIIATSNAGYQVILEAIRLQTEWKTIKQKLLDYIFENSIFRPEFINRFDAVVVFSPLSKENLLDIAELQLQKIKKNLEDKNIEFAITKRLKERIVELGYDPTFGARNMKRVIQDSVENAIAKALLAEEIKRADKIEIDPDNFSLRKTGIKGISPPA